MKVLVTFLTLAAFSLGAFAAEPPDKRLALEFLKVSQFEQVIETSIQAYGHHLPKDFPAESRADFEKVMRGLMGWEVIKDDLANIVIGLYTKEELKAFLAFAKTHHGASYNAKTIRFSNEFSTLLSSKLQKLTANAPTTPPNQASTSSDVAK